MLMLSLDTILGIQANITSGEIYTNHPLIPSNRVNACDREEKYEGLCKEFADRVNTLYIDRFSSMC